MHKISQNTGRPRRWKIWVTSALGIVLVLILILWWRLWQGGLHIGPASANLSKIASSDSFTSSSATTSGDNAHFASGRIVILSQSNHPLIARVGPLLRDELGKLPFVTQVICLPPGGHPIDGAPLPDLVIRIDPKGIDENSSVYERTLSAKIQIHMTSGADREPNGYFDDLAPPIVSLSWKGSLEHRSTSIGDGVGAERYRLTAPHIASEISKAISAELKKLNKEHGAFPALPPPFYGTFRAAPDLDAIKQTASPPELRGPALFCHNESVWTFTDSRDSKVVFDEVESAMKAKGWTKQDSQLDNNAAYLRMSSGSRMLNVYRHRDFGLGDDAQDASQSSPQYTIHYVDRFSHEDVDAAVKSLDDSSHTELLLSLRRLLSPAMRDRLIQQLEMSTPPTADAHLYLAEHFSQSQPEKAKAHLRCAAILMTVMEDDTSSRGRVDDLSKKLHITKLNNDVPTDQTLKDLQIFRLSKTTPSQRTVELDEPVLGYSKAANGEVHLISVRVRRASDSKESPYEVAHVIGGEHGKSFGTSGGRTDPSGVWIGEGATGFNQTTIEWQAKDLGNDKFNITIKETR
jgi:hypothetical protein